MCKGFVNRILPFSYVDGPGNRCAVFLQGCGFACKYCHNPETNRLCIGCGLCVKECPQKALTLTPDGVVWNRDLCCTCDHCLKVCPYSSSPRVREMTPGQVIKELEAALPFVEGMTISGGECTQQHPFVTALVCRAHSLGMTAFVDTNGQTDFREMPELTGDMDMAMLDVKSTDPQEHKMLTGQPNDTVLRNAEYLASIGKLYEIRTVIVPGVLDNRRTVGDASRLIAPYPAVRYKLIRFRKWGVRGPFQDLPSPDDSLMESLKMLAHSNGVRKVEVV